MSNESEGYVGFWWRVVANMVDMSMLMILVYLPLFYGFGYLGDEGTVQAVGWIPQGSRVGPSEAVDFA